MVECIYFIQDTVVDNDGGYIPCIAERDMPGYHKTDWNWGKDKEIAQSIADEKNLRMGYTPKESLLIMFSSMRAEREY